MNLRVRRVTGLSLSAMVAVVVDGISGWLTGERDLLADALHESRGFKGWRPAVVLGAKIPTRPCRLLGSNPKNVCVEKIISGARPFTAEIPRGRSRALASSPHGPVGALSGNRFPFWARHQVSLELRTA